MLKWLVQKSGGHINNSAVITDDPLATLDLERVLRKQKNNKEIYSVNRTNPLYAPDEDELRITSGSSSGYASNHNKPRKTVVGQLHTAGGEKEIFHSDLEIEAAHRSFEDHHQFGLPPQPIWPQKGPTGPVAKKVYSKNKETASNSHLPVVFLEKNSKFVSEIEMFKSKPNATVFDVIKNDNFVGGIKFGNKDFESVKHISEQPDSIVTDSLLQMTSFTSSSGRSKLQHEMDEDSLEYKVKKREDMDNVIKELTLAVIKSRPKAMNKSQYSSTSSSSELLMSRSKLRSSLRALKKKTVQPGFEVMKELWEKSGKKTNGRKLLAVDSMSEEDLRNVSKNGAHFKRQRRVRRRSSKVPKKNIPRKTSDSSSSTFSTTSSQHFYSSVYNGDKIVSSEYDDSSESGSQSKRVTFRPDVVDNEKKMRKKARKKSSSVVIDVEKLNENTKFRGGFNNHHYWESYYGASGKFAGDPEKYNPPQLPNVVPDKTDYGSAVFESPYFDYRRTHSRAGSSSGAESNISQGRRQRKILLDRKSGENFLCSYWKSFLTVSLFGVVLVVLVLLTVFIMDRKKLSSDLSE